MTETHSSFQKISNKIYNGNVPSVNCKESFGTCSKKINIQNGITTKTTQKIIDQQVLRLRQALCQAIDENQLLRGRVIELESLLAAAEMQNEDTQKKYLIDLGRFRKNNNFNYKDDTMLYNNNFNRSKSI